MTCVARSTDPNVLPLPADKNDTEVRAITAEDKALVYAKLRIERMNARVAGAVSIRIGGHVTAQMI